MVVVSMFFTHAVHCILIFNLNFMEVKPVVMVLLLTCGLDATPVQSLSFVRVFGLSTSLWYME